jgi:hypothetical protein
MERMVVRRKANDEGDLPWLPDIVAQKSSTLGDRR